jgi:hypothetical protein
LELGPRVGRVTTGQHESPHGPKSDDPICDLERERGKNVTSLLNVHYRLRQSCSIRN